MYGKELSRISHPILWGAITGPVFRSVLSDDWLDPPQRSGRNPPSPFRLLQTLDPTLPEAFGAGARRTPIVGPRPGGPSPAGIVYASSAQHIRILGRNRTRFACVRRNPSASGQPLDSVSSRRFNVLLPARVLPRSRRRWRDRPVGSSLATTVASPGSRRRSSWSLRSSEPRARA